MPVVPNFLERLFFVRTQRGPGLFIDVCGAGALRVASLGVKLGIFERLRTGAKSVPQVARAIGAGDEGTAALLDALVLTGYLRKNGGKYSNTKGTDAWLTSSRPTNWFSVARWWNDLVFRFWAENLETAVRQGMPPIRFYTWLNGIPDGWRIAQSAFAAYARPVADLIARRVPLPATARRLLDVGGGHGLYSVAFCRQNPALTATVVDSPGAVEVAQGILAAEGMTGRVATEVADLRSDDLGLGYDIALLFSVVHGFSPDGNLDLLHRVEQAMNPGGIVAIMEQTPGAGLGPVTRAFGGILGLTYFAGLSGRMYSFEEMGTWLERTGFGNVRRIPLRRVLGGLLLASKPG